MIGTIVRALERIQYQMSKAGVANAATFNRGLRAPELAARTRVLPFELGPELVELYQYCDGMTGPWGTDRLFTVYRLLPLAEAIELHRFWGTLNRPGWEFRAPHLFPIFDFDASNYSVWCGPGANRNAVFLSHKETLPRIVFDHVSAMFEALAECWECGAYFLDAGTEHLEEDSRQALQIHRRHNRGRVEALLASLNLPHALERMDEGASAALDELVDERAIPALARIFEHTIGREEHAHACARAVRALAAIGSPLAFDTLMQALASGRDELQIPAIQGLAALGDLRAVPVLAELFTRGSRSTTERRKTARRPAAPHLGRQARRAPDYVRAHLAAAFEHLRDPRAADACISALTSDDETCRADAARALRGLRDPRSLDALVRALVDEDELVVAHAAEALGELGAESAVPHLLSVLEQSCSELDRFERYLRLASGIQFTPGARCAQALAKIASPRASGALSLLLSELRADVDRDTSPARLFGACHLSGELAAALASCSRDRPDATLHLEWLRSIALAEKQIAAHAAYVTSGARKEHLVLLARCDDEAVAKVFTASFAADDKVTRHHIVDALRSARAPWARDILSRALLDAELYVREHAARVIGEAKRDDCLTPLVQALEDESALVRLQSARALGEIAAPGSPALFAALEDEHVAVLAETLRALAKTGFPGATEALERCAAAPSAVVRWTAEELLAKRRS